MNGFILIFFLQTIAMLITAFLIPRFTVEGPISALKFVLVLALINTTIWNTTLFGALPDSATAHTLTVVLANGALFWILAKVMPGVAIDGLLPAVAGPIVFSVVSALTFAYGKDVDWIGVFNTIGNQVSEIRDNLSQTHSEIKPAEQGRGTVEGARHIVQPGE